MIRGSVPFLHVPKKGWAVWVFRTPRVFPSKNFFTQMSTEFILASRSHVELETGCEVRLLAR